MELNEFIKETLVQIADGAKQADDEYKKLGHGAVSPSGDFHLDGIPHLLQVHVGGRNNFSKPIVQVQFKLNIQLEEKNQAGGKISGLLNVISASVHGTMEEGNRSVQEISFSIPVALP